MVLGFGVWGLGFRVWGLGFGVWGLGLGGSGFGVWGCWVLVSCLPGSFYPELPGALQLPRRTQPRAAVL